ncbi:MAG TPA: sugar transferase, partial [Chloroflexota bacterium]
MNRPFTLFFSLFLLAQDICLMIAAFVASYWLRLQMEPRAGITMPSLRSYQDLLALIVAGVVITLFAARLYVPQRGASRIDIFYSVLLGVTAGMLLGLGVSAFLFKGMDYPRWVLVSAWGSSILLLWLARMVLHGLISILRSLGVDQRRLLIVGAGETGRIVYDRIAIWPGLGYSVVGFLEDDSSVSPPVDMPVLGAIDELPHVVREYSIDEVIFASPSISHRQITQLLSDCGKQKLDVKVFPDIFQVMSSEVSVTELGGLPLVRLRDVALRGWNLTIKRSMDLAFSSFTLVLLSPMMLTAALFIKLTSPRGPVFFAQTRVGLDGRPFELLKFRSMRPDAEVATGPVWATEGDQR